MTYDYKIKNNEHYEKHSINSNLPICYSCGFNEKNNKPINMCKVKTTRNKISIDYVESDSNGEIELNFCVDCVLYGFSSGEIMALNGAKMTKRYGNSGIWKQLEEKIEKK